MTLQRKFLVLIVLLSVTAAVSLGGALWSVGLLEREFSTPFTATTRLSRDVRAATAATRALRLVLVTPPDAPGIDPAPLADRLERFAEANRALGDLDYGAVRIGPRFVTLLHESSRLVFEAGQELAPTRSQAPPPSTTRAEMLGLVDAHLELLSRLDSQAFESAELAVGHVVSLRRGILVFQGVAVSTAMLAAVLALLLHRRWIVIPVQRLRAGTERLAEGDLTARVPAGTDDELGLLGREVNQMAATVARMQREAIDRERFAAVGQVVRRLAHNIRNPLAGIRGLAETSRDDLRQSAGPTAETGAGLIDAQERIIRTVDAFDGWLTGFLSATAPHTVQPRETPVPEWARGWVTALEPMAEARGVTLTLDAGAAPPRAAFDPAQLEQALVAVATNAVEASPEGGRVGVVVSTHEGGWAVVVTDEGAGVPDGDEDKIFEVDYTTKPGGHGIGLSTARWIVRQHGGKMSVGRAPGGGARFEIRIPEIHNASDNGEVDRAERADP